MLCRLLLSLIDQLSDHDTFDSSWMDEAKFYGKPVSHTPVPVTTKQKTEIIFWRFEDHENTKTMYVPGQG